MVGLLGRSCVSPRSSALAIVAVLHPQEEGAWQKWRGHVEEIHGVKALSIGVEEDLDDELEGMTGYGPEANEEVKVVEEGLFVRV